MFSLKKAPAILAAAIIALSVVSNAYAAKKVYASGHKVAVPASILSGSAKTGGRAFYKTSVPEDSLAGIRLGRDAKEILSKYGNPSRITVGVANTEQPGQGRRRVSRRALRRAPPRIRCRGCRECPLRGVLCPAGCRGCRRSPRRVECPECRGCQASQVRRRAGPGS